MVWDNIIELAQPNGTVPAHSEAGTWFKSAVICFGAFSVCHVIVLVLFLPKKVSCELLRIFIFTLKVAIRNKRGVTARHHGHVNTETYSLFEKMCIRVYIPFIRCVIICKYELFLE